MLYECPASLLLDSLLSYLTSGEQNDCKAVYLHVLTTNTTAILFYERRNFRVHCCLPYYYSINGCPHDGYSYVLYINGGQPSSPLLYPLETARRFISLIIQIKILLVVSAVRIFEISNQILTSVFDSKRAPLFGIFEYLPSPISYLFNRMTPIFHLSNHA